MFTVRVNYRGDTQFCQRFRFPAVVSFLRELAVAFFCRLVSLARAGASSTLEFTIYRAFRPLLTIFLRDVIGCQGTPSAFI